MEGKKKVGTRTPEETGKAASGRGWDLATRSHVVAILPLEECGVLDFM